MKTELKEPYSKDKIVSTTLLNNSKPVLIILKDFHKK